MAKNVWGFGVIRQARQRCESGIYHVVLRGINRGDIFFNDDDNLRFLETLAQKKRNQEYGLYGYCLMSNHIHLLLRENEDTCLDEEKNKKTDGEVKAEIEALMDGEPIGKLQGMEKEKRNPILRTIKASEGVTLRQIARVTGLNPMNVQRS